LAESATGLVLWFASPLLASPWLATLLAWSKLSTIMLVMGLVCLGVLVVSLMSTFSAPVSRRQILSRLQPYIDRDENMSPLERIVERAEADARRKGSTRAKRRGDLLPTLSKWIANSRIKILNTLSSDLTRIGSNWRPSEIVYGGASLALFVFFIVGVVFRQLGIGLGVAALAFFAPFALVRFLARRWTTRFEQQLADTLLLMANATQAGYGFQQAMEMVAREGVPPMSDEFAKMNQEVRLGVPIAEALNHMGERVQNRDLFLTITAIQISMEVGGALSEILRTISEAIRERVRIRGEIAVLSTQGKMTGLILSGLPVFLFFVLNLITRTPGEKPYMDPLFNGKEYPMGPKLVAAGIISEVIGFMAIQKIVNIEV
jgi:tight adherence protein B